MAQRKTVSVFVFHHIAQIERITRGVAIKYRICGIDDHVTCTRRKVIRQGIRTRFPVDEMPSDPNVAAGSNRS